jgi:hypothetical protein
VAIWAVLGVGLALAIGVVVLIRMGTHLDAPSPGVVSPAVAMIVVMALINRIRPLGLDRAGLHIGSADQGYVLSWSKVRGVVTVPRSLFQPERIRIRIADRSLAPGWWARLRWGVRVLPGADLELILGYRQTGAEIATEVRHFIDAYG